VSKLEVESSADKKSRSTGAAQAVTSKAQLLWSLYLSERDFIRHHETQRTTASNILAAVAAGLIVASGTSERGFPYSVIVPILLIGIGVFGFLFCGRLYSLLQLHANRSYKYLQALEVEHPDLLISEVKKTVDADQARKYPFFSKLKLNRVWAAFHLMIVLSGALFLIVALTDIATDQWPWLTSIVARRNAPPI